MGKEDKRKRAASAAEAEVEETVDLFCDESAPDKETEASQEDNPIDETMTESAGEAASEVNVSEEADTSENAEAEAGEEPETGSGDRKKAAKKDKKDEKIAELSDKLLRQQAEFINFRNRTEKEKAQMFEVGARSAFEKILPVIDNFERGLATLSEEDKAQPFASGIDKTYRQLMTVLTEAGVTPIEAVGQPFDPDLHNAVMHVEDETVGENIVVEEFQKGYRYRDSVLRHSMVKVAN